MTTSLARCPDDLTDPNLHAEGDPHPLWRWMREEAPCHHHLPSALPAFWSLTRYTDVRTAYRDPLTFSSARGVLLRPTQAGADPAGGMTLALTDPPRHKQLRGLVAAWFTERSARMVEGSVRAAVRAALDHAIEQGSCDIVHDLAGRLSSYLICSLLGVPEHDHEVIFRWSDEAYAAHAPLAAHRMLMQYFAELMFQRMEVPEDDIVSALANGLVCDELLTEQEILLNLENLIGATENGRLAIAGGILALLDHPGELRLLYDDRRLLPSAVEEILRWTSSATHSMRTATTPTEVFGPRIEAGDRVVLWLPSANRDHAVFHHPDTFDVRRVPNRHLALGVGEHFCLGSTMARIQLRVLLSELLDTVRTIEPDGAVRAVRSIAVNGPAYLPVRMHRR